ncbi:AAA family ATPase [Aporhodopirellula aestuarii]|uniref:ATP-binding protein n=1 Tax=Aporhodopirellula aestuarii TaxID=2950107 RepID=A0ABT0U864_9BACT|nr:ATP-binding protein [Aporhodopirellula aestuarii]MCM2372730.1 ATP-binding protein [Aporhodopirellula aestuarii]
MAYLGWMFAGVMLGWVLAFLVRTKSFMIMNSFGNDEQDGSQQLVAPLLKSHFHPTPTSQITITERRFPFRMRADLQRTIDKLLGSEITVKHFFGVRCEYSACAPTLTDCILESMNNPTYSVPPEYEELDIGDEQPLRVLKNGLWLLEAEEVRFAVMLSPCGQFGEVSGMQFQVGSPLSQKGSQIAQRFFKQLEDAVARGESYRGKILSLEQAEHSYSGESNGITVHKLRDVRREDVILPAETLTLLERNVVQFARNRERLSQLGMSKKKGILFYGPPGTGKTHTIHHLAASLAGHTTILISAEQVGLLGEYMTLARLLQPSMVVMEDVDLIARERTKMESVCEEVLLNKLLNEMDGLKEDAEIFFVLTTNRPEALEAALASRPGRIDQAIEFPLPDAEGRRKLANLYASKGLLDNGLIDEVVRRTDGVSAAFIKELMRRSSQFSIERDADSPLTHADLDSALDEMLFKGGTLNRKLLGAGQNQSES